MDIKTLAFYLFVIIAWCSSCKEDEECFTPPPKFILDIRDKNNISILPNHEEKDIVFYYFNESNKKSNVEFYKEAGFVVSNQLPFLSLEGNRLFLLPWVLKRIPYFSQ